MEKAIATVMLTVASIVAIIAVLNTLMPAISRTNASIIATADSVDGRIATQIEIVHASGADASLTVEAWVKNVGAQEVKPLSRVDVFFGPAEAFVRVPYGDPGCISPCWNYTIENDTRWNPTATVRITVNLDVAIAGGSSYYLKVVTPNGISDARFFTV
jgi:flagellar protein FlaG